MKLTRREFLKLCGGTAVGMGISRVYIPQIAAALEGAARGNPPVLWLQGAGDTAFTMKMMILSRFVIRLPLSWILAINSKVSS